MRIQTMPVGRTTFQPVTAFCGEKPAPVAVKSKPPTETQPKKPSFLKRSWQGVCRFFSKLASYLPSGGSNRLNVSSDGSTQIRNGNVTVDTQGRTYYHSGNMAVGSDGSVQVRSGNVSIGTDGKVVYHFQD